MSELSFLKPVEKPIKTTDEGGPLVAVEEQGSDPYALEPVKLALTQYEPQVSELLEAASAVTIVDDGSNSEAVAVAGQCKKLAKALENRRKEIVNAPNDFIRSVNALVKNVTARLDGAERDIKQKIGQYQAKQELERRKAEEKRRKALAEAQKKLDEEAAKEGVPPVELKPVPEPEPPKVTRTESGSASVAKVWTFEITNPDEVPREFLMVDEKKIRQAVKDGLRELAGVRIYEDSQVRIRS